MILTLVLVFAILLAISVPVAFAMGIAITVAIIFFGDISLVMIPHKMVNGIDSFVFLAIPLFLLAGRLMNAGGITDRLFSFARAWVGAVSGGLAQANVVAGTLFAWMSGSAVAAVGGLGEIEVKAMKDNGYDVPFAASVATASSVLGPIIPPSIPMIIYAAMTEESIGRLFFGGVIPGLMMAGSLMLLIYFIAVKRNYPKDSRTNMREKLIATINAVLPLSMPVVMLGGIATGWFTPTEAAAVAAAYALFIGMVVYKSIKFRDLPRIFVETMVTTAVVTFIISTTSPFSFILVIQNAGAEMAQFVLGLTDNVTLVLLLVNIILLLFGAMMEAGVVLILFIPILYPLVVTQLGVNPIHFGVIMCVNVMIGVVTPPVGMALFVMSHISKLRMETLSRAILPFLVPLILCLLILTYWPEVVTFLPDYFMGE